MSDPQYLPIPLAFITSDRPLRFDIYLPVGARYVNYSRRGQPVDEERLQRLHTKNIDQVYIHTLDRLAYEVWLAEDADRAFRGGDKLKDRVDIVVAYAQWVAARFMEDTRDKDLYDQLRATCERLVTFLTSEPFAVGQILAAPKAPGVGVLRHSVNVAALAVTMVQKQRPPAGTPVHLLAAGCLLHDIDHYRTDRDLARRPEDMSNAERREYHEHPMNGANLFTESPFVDQLVTSIIAQHEEMMDGSGYPRKIKGDRMDTMVLVAGAANAYDRLVSFEGRAPRDALKHLLIDKMGQYPLEDLKTLQDVLKVAEVV